MIKPVFLLLILPLTMTGCAHTNRVERLNPVISVPLSEPFVSPNGELIGFTAAGSIWVTSINGGPAEKVSASDGVASRGRFSPNGDQIAYALRTEHGFHIVIRSIASGREYRLMPSRRWDTIHEGASPKWDDIGIIFDFLPSGHEIVVQSITGVYKVDIYSREYDVFPKIELAEFSLSEDGKVALSHFSRESFDDDRSSETLVEAAAQKRARISLVDIFNGTLHNLLASRDVGYYNARFSKNERAIFFVEWSQGIEKIVEFDLASQEEVIVEQGILGNRQFEIHPDGKTLIVTRDGELNRIHIREGRSTPISVHLPIATRSEPTSVTILDAMLFDGNSDAAERVACIIVKKGVMSLISKDKNDCVNGRSARVIHANGRFVMAGLVDSHAHVSYQSPLRLTDLLRAGVTSVIDSAGDYPTVLDYRAMSEFGEFELPRILAFSESFDGRGKPVSSTKYTSNIVDPDISAALVNRYSRLGYDGIKMYSTLSPENARAVVVTSETEGLKVLGDLGSLTWRMRLIWALML